MWIAVGIFTGFVAVSLFWRYGARKVHAPCPAWAAWILSAGGERPLGRSRALDELALAPGMRVADVGCGPGRLTIPIARRIAPDGEVVALDLQRAMLDKLERRVKRDNVSNIRVVQGGAGQGHLPENYFDRALLATVLGEIPDRASALREIRGALKPGGYLVVAEVIGDPHYQFKKKVRALAESAGLRPGEVAGGFFAYTIRLYRPESD